MADGISFRMDTAPFHKAIAEKERRMNRAAMWAVRQTGRQVARAARAHTPVLGDRTRSSESTLRGYRRRGFDTGAAYDRPVPGLLRASIRPSRKLTRHGTGSVSLKVGPRGLRAHLYAQKIEARAGYMAAGERAANAQMEAIAKAAFGRVWKG